MQDFDGFRRAVGFQMRFGNLQEERTRLAEYALLLVKISEAFEGSEFRGR